MEVAEIWILGNFKYVTSKFLGNKTNQNFKLIPGNMLQKYKYVNLECSMSLKIHFLNSHFDYFLLGTVIKEILHLNIKETERRYQLNRLLGWWQAAVACYTEINPMKKIKVKTRRKSMRGKKKFHTWNKIVRIKYKNTCLHVYNFICLAVKMHSIRQQMNKLLYLEVLCLFYIRFSQ